MCAICAKYKLTIRQLGHDLNERQAQRRLLQQHYESQYRDRQTYWNLRAESQLQGALVVFIADAIDQAKTARPRAAFLLSHDFDKFVRPRLRLTGIVVHGHAFAYAVADPMMKKSGCTTVQYVCWVLQMLRRRGVDLKNCWLHGQFDNAASENKNNTVMQFMAYLVSAGICKRTTMGFLQTGHTHEDVDQEHGALARWIVNRLQTAEVIEDVIRCVRDFVTRRNRPREPVREVFRVSSARNWGEWLSKLQASITGIGGPGAPHFFSFQQRQGASGRSHKVEDHFACPGVVHKT